MRFVESGICEGFMKQTYLSLIRLQYSITDDDIVLHQAFTSEDVDTLRGEYSQEKCNRNRPQKVFEYSISKVLPQQIADLQNIKVSPEVSLKSAVIHCLPYKGKVLIDNPSKVYLQSCGENLVNDLDDILVDFRLNKLESGKSSWKDLLTEFAPVHGSLLQQSIILNSLCRYIHQRPDIFNRKSRFESNCTHLCTGQLTTS